MWYKIKSENVYKKSKDSDLTISNNKPLSEPEWKMNKHKDTASKLLLYSQNSKNLNKLDKDI